MKKIITLAYALGACMLSVMAQTAVTIDFENLGLSKKDTMVNGALDNGGRWIEDVYFPSSFKSWGFAGGFAFSSYIDTVTEGYTNQFSAYNGTGFAKSNAYSVSNGTTSLSFKQPVEFRSLHVTNSTYAALSMKKGDTFAKKFGGATGTDPDFFRLIMKGYLGGSYVDSNVIYLADFRSQTSSEDFIAKDWLPFSFSSIHTLDSISFKLESSDVGQWGMNTPNYFCLDHISYTKTITDLSSSEKEISLSVFPNPVVHSLTISQLVDHVKVISPNGTIVKEMFDNNTLDVSDLQQGVYVVEVIQNDKKEFFKVFKK